MKAVPTAAAASAAPKVFFTEKPAELLLFKSAPAYAKIRGTALQYATNTESNVFLLIPIEFTAMFYAVNTPYKVVRVGDLYYLCYQGIWFIGASPNGPWKTDSIPPVIYTIPPTSPVYNVTYVMVSNPTPTTVEMSYSAGYTGMFVMGMAVGATIVYGTGY